MSDSGWSPAVLGELIDIKHGYAFEGRYFRDFPPGDILLTPGNFEIGGGFKSAKFKYYVGPVPEDFILSSGDLLVSMTDLSKQSDTLGYPALVPSLDGPKFLHNQRLGKVIIKAGAELDHQFLYYLLCTDKYRDEVLASATGTTVKHTSPSRIMAFKFSCPTLPQQRAIARVLSLVDRKIELNKRMNDSLEAVVHLVFKDWFIDPAKQELPEDWHQGKLIDEFNLTMGQSPPGESYNEVGDGIPFFQGSADFGFRYPKSRVFCTAPTRFANPGDSLVSVRAPVGEINMAAEACAVGRGVAAVRHKTGSRSYTYYRLKSLETNFNRFEAEGTVFGSITKGGFEDIDCLIPPPTLVEEFENRASPIDQRIENNEKESGTLIQLRNTLLPKLMSGEIQTQDATSLEGVLDG